MTDSSLIERITRSLAFMLRHQPEQFDLELDPQGWADLGEVVRALNERLGEPVNEADVQAAVSAGDRARYEIRADKIRALYGHSIQVEPGPASKPPELLYVAIPSQDVERAKRFGLRGGRRRFLHLALSEADACEGGRRGSRDYTVLTIRALEAWEEGVNFYDRQLLWLAEEIPTHLLQVGETHHDGRESLHGDREEGGREGRFSHDSHRRGRHDRRGRERHHAEDRGAGAPAGLEEPRESGESPERPGSFAGRPDEDGGRRRQRGRGRGRDRDRNHDRDRDRDRGPRHAEEPGRSTYGGDQREAQPARLDEPRRAEPAPFQRQSEESAVPFGAGLSGSEPAPRREPRPERRSEPQSPPTPAPPTPAKSSGGSGDTPFGAGL